MANIIKKFRGWIDKQSKQYADDYRKKHKLKPDDCIHCDGEGMMQGVDQGEQGEKCVWCNGTGKVK